MKIFESLSSWSFSRDRMLRECPRKFHFHYIAARGGHRPGGPPGSREAWLAKKYSAIPIEIGSLVHKAISNIWWRRIGGGPANIAEETQQAQMAFIKLVLASDRADGNGSGSEKRFLNDVFGPPLVLADLQAADRAIWDMMVKFEAFPFVRSLLADPRPIMTRYLDCDQPEISHALGFPCWLKTDLVIRQQNGVDIVEWKTGRPSPAHSIQAEVYDLYLRKSELLPDETPTRVHVAYLKSGHIDTREFGTAERSLALRRVEDGYDHIAGLFAAGAAECLVADRFPPQPGRHCCGCNFQGLCPESATKKSTAPALVPLVIEDDF